MAFLFGFLEGEKKEKKRKKMFLSFFLVVILLFSFIIFILLLNFISKFIGFFFFSFYSMLYFISTVVLLPGEAPQPRSGSRGVRGMQEGCGRDAGAAPAPPAALPRSSHGFFSAEVSRMADAEGKKY